MCMAGDDGDYWQFFQQTAPRARKPHWCGECGREIDAGERYHRYTGLFDGNWWTGKTCDHCATAARWLGEICDGYLHGAVGADLGEHWNEPGSSVALGRLIVGMRRRWRRPSGDLWPVDTVAGWAAEAIDRWEVTYARRAAFAAAREAAWWARRPLAA